VLADGEEAVPRFGELFVTCAVGETKRPAVAKEKVVPTRLVSP
jgi:hypothetical protein